jgi:hypothetical protein
MTREPRSGDQTVQDYIGNQEAHHIGFHLQDRTLREQ